MNRIKVIVPVCTDIWNAPVAALMERYKEPDTQIDIVNLDAGPESLEFAYDKACAELPTVKQAETAQREGFAGVIIYCFADPGLAAAKEALSIPVVGLYFAENGRRHRSIGCRTCCMPVPSDAASVGDIVEELAVTKVAERSGRAQDKESVYVMQKLRSLGYM